MSGVCSTDACETWQKRFKTILFVTLELRKTNLLSPADRSLLPLIWRETVIGGVFFISFRRRINTAALLCIVRKSRFKNKLLIINECESSSLKC
jgi:hypothetical protein